MNHLVLCPCIFIMQVIKDKYEQNLKTIKELEELIQKLHFQVYNKNLAIFSN